MTTLIAGSVLVGVILGRFFKVLVLLPAILCLLAIVIGRAIYFEHGLLRLGLESAAAVTSLQIGYAAILITIAIKLMLQRIKSPRPQLRSEATFPIAAARRR
ncbi:MAG: hypothetical protein L0Y50_11790 [Beijerinckiaceae bacterium]|nr:hypothetical protein [Beijerinckiaceae bacterium]MCI0736930.1 hypothetical protein [Beijerinckiaceae bacterium]